MRGDTFTSEIKFVITEDTAEAVREWARLRLPADPNAPGDGDGYRTTTLYFDTENLDLFYRRGPHARAKFRIRRYGDGPTVFLERKLKSGDRRSKHRSGMQARDLAKLLSGGHGSGSWFVRRLEHRGLQPICQVAYDRAAYVDTSATLTPRLTIDRNVTAATIHSVAFTHDSGVAILPGQAILELKYGAHAPDIFNRLIAEFHLTPRSLSKYRLAVRALGLAADRETAIDSINSNQPLEVQQYNFCNLENR
jgi:hypothetical protein